MTVTEVAFWPVLTPEDLLVPSTGKQPKRDLGVGGGQGRGRWRQPRGSKEYCWWHHRMETKAWNEGESAKLDGRADGDSWGGTDVDAQWEGAQRHIELYERARGLLVSFKKEQFKVLETFRHLPQAIKTLNHLFPPVDCTWVELEGITWENREVTLDIFLIDGFLIPTFEQLAALQRKHGL